MSVSVASASSKSPASLDDLRENAWSQKLSLIKTTTLNRFDIFLFGMNIVLGKQFNDPYFGGFSSMITAMLFTGLGYVFLTFCLAEMASTLPFSGGIYGFVRAFTIPIFGFYIAWFELLTNLFYHTTQIYLLSQIPIEIGVSPKSMTLVYCGLINIYLLIVHMIEGKLYWAINLIFGCVVLLLVFIYIFGSFHEINMDRWASSSEPFHFQNVLRLLHRASMSYLGIQVLPLTNKWAKNSRTDIPFVTNIATAVMFVTGIALAVLASGNRPGISVIGDSNYPLSYGFARIFGISVTAATWFSFPAYLANVTSLTFSAARQAINLANSGFSPPFFRWLIPVLETPYLALLGGCSCSFLLNVLIVYQEKALEQMIILTSLASQIVFVFAFLAYICFRGHYTSLVRSFVSPFGTIGAYIGLVIFSLSFIGTVAAQVGGWSPIVTIVGTTIFMVICYVIFIGGNQSFSEEEKNKLFKAYLVNANSAAKSRLRKYKNPNRMSYTAAYSAKTVTASTGQHCLFADNQQSSLSLEHKRSMESNQSSDQQTDVLEEKVLFRATIAPSHNQKDHNLHPEAPFPTGRSSMSDLFKAVTSTFSTRAPGPCHTNSTIAVTNDQQLDGDTEPVVEDKQQEEQGNAAPQDEHKPVDFKNESTSRKEFQSLPAIVDVVESNQTSSQHQRSLSFYAPSRSNSILHSFSSSKNPLKSSSLSEKFGKVRKMISLRLSQVFQEQDMQLHTLMILQEGGEFLLSPDCSYHSNEGSRSVSRHVDGPPPLPDHHQQDRELEQRVSESGPVPCDDLIPVPDLSNNPKSNDDSMNLESMPPSIRR